MMGASSSRRVDAGFLRRWAVELRAAGAVVGMLLLSVSAGMLRR